MLKSAVGQITRMGTLFGLSRHETETDRNRAATIATQVYREAFQQRFGTTASVDPLFRHKRCPKNHAS